MDDLINQLVSKAGISHEQAQKVIEVIKENADKLPALMGQSGIADKLPGGLGGMFGGKKD